MEIKRKKPILPKLIIFAGILLIAFGLFNMYVLDKEGVISANVVPTNDPEIAAHYKYVAINRFFLKENGRPIIPKGKTMINDLPMSLKLQALYYNIKSRYENEAARRNLPHPEYLYVKKDGSIEHSFTVLEFKAAYLTIFPKEDFYEAVEFKTNDGIVFKPEGYRFVGIVPATKPQENPNERNYYSVAKARKTDKQIIIYEVHSIYNKETGLLTDAKGKVIKKYKKQEEAPDPLLVMQLVTKAPAYKHVLNKDDLDRYIYTSIELVDSY